MPACTPLGMQSPTEKRAKRSWKKGDVHGDITIVDLYRKEVAQKNGETKTYSFASIRCVCGAEKEIYLANIIRTKSCSTSCWHDRHAHSRYQDLTGRWFGFLWVLGRGPDELVGASKEVRTTWMVYCQSCNAYPDEPVRASALTSGNTTRCGACRTKKKSDLINLEGRSFGKLKVVREWGVKKPVSRAHGERVWLCRCLGCNNTDAYQQNNLRSGNSTQCSSCRGLFRDNLDNLLRDADFSGSSCYFYVARVDDYYLKPGIANDVEVRAKCSDGKYSQYFYVTDELTRGDAWTIERLVLDATSPFRPKTLSSDFAEWAGSTELRDPTLITADELLQFASQAVSDVMNVGWRALWLNPGNELVSRWKLTFKSLGGDGQEKS